MPLGRPAQSATSLSESFRIFVSLPFLLLFLTVQVCRGIVVEQRQCGWVSVGSQMAPALVCSSEGYFPNRAVSHLQISPILPITQGLQLVCPLCLSSVCCRSPQLQDHLSVSQFVSVGASQSTQLVVRCALLGSTEEKALACHVSGVMTNRC